MSERDMATRYLLGELPEEEARGVEEEAFLDSAAAEAMAAAEGDLYAAYAGGELTDDEAARFEARFLGTDAGRDRLAFAAALVQQADAAATAAAGAREAAEVPQVAEGPGLWARIKAVLWPEVPVARFALAAAMIALIAVAGRGLLVPPAVPDAAVLDLASTVRGTSEVPSVAVAEGAGLRLRVAPDVDEPSDTFRALVARGDAVVWTSDVRTRDADGFVVVELPASAVATGRHTLRLQGRSGDTAPWAELARMPFDIEVR